MKFIFAFCFLFVAIPFSGLFAQTVTSTDLSSVISLSDDNDWSVFFDDHQKTAYIDFAKIHNNLSDLLVVNAKGEIVYQENIWQLPKNTIFELDYSQFAPGAYKMSIRTYSKTIEHTFIVK